MTKRAAMDLVVNAGVKHQDGMQGWEPISMRGEALGRQGWEPILMGCEASGQQGWEPILTREASGQQGWEPILTRGAATGRQG